MTKNIKFRKLISINSRPKHNPLPECDPVLLGLFCEALLPLLIETPHLAVLLHVSFCLFCQREIWSIQVKIGAVLTERRGEERTVLSGTMHRGTHQSVNIELQVRHKHLLFPDILPDIYALNMVLLVECGALQVGFYRSSAQLS